MQVALRVKAVISVPRLGFNDHFGSVFEALGTFGIMPAWYTGAFWEKGIETALEDSLFGIEASEERPAWDPTRELKCDVILALDYDTLCTADHVRTLLHAMAERPDIDALASNQPRRGTGAPLCGIKGKTGDYATNGPFLVDSAAFGLTAIRAKSLLKLSKPWFWATPSDERPQNRDAFLDPDMYFWAKWKAAGLTAYVDPSANIGHLEGLVSLFEEVQELSITEQLAAKRAEIEALEKRVQAGDDANERRIVLKQNFIRCSEWRAKHRRREGGRSLEEHEELTR